MSEVIYQRYLEFLDGQKSYFLQSDINDFSAYRFQFDDMIRTGDVDPAYLDLRALPAAQPRAHRSTRSRCSAPSRTGR